MIRSCAEKIHNTTLNSLDPSRNLRTISYRRQEQVITSHLSSILGPIEREMDEAREISYLTIQTIDTPGGGVLENLGRAYLTSNDCGSIEIPQDRRISAFSTSKRI